MSFENYFPLWNDLNTALVLCQEKVQIKCNQFSLF